MPGGMKRIRYVFCVSDIYGGGYGANCGGDTEGDCCVSEMNTATQNPNDEIKSGIRKRAAAFFAA